MRVTTRLARARSSSRRRVARRSRRDLGADSRHKAEKRTRAFAKGHPGSEKTLSSEGRPALALLPFPRDDATGCEAALRRGDDDSPVRIPQIFEIILPQPAHPSVERSLSSRLSAVSHALPSSQSLVVSATCACDAAATSPASSDAHSCSNFPHTDADTSARFSFHSRPAMRLLLSSTSFFRAGFAPAAASHC